MWSWEARKAAPEAGRHLIGGKRAATAAEIVPGSTSSLQVAPKVGSPFAG
jgi:hypothetical protein